MGEAQYRFFIFSNEHLFSTLGRQFELDQPALGLLVPALVWHELDRFSEDAICAVLASREYRDDDYIRDRGQFLAARAAHGR